MSDDSKIEWTDATWNPVRGCSAVSEGCRNCYATRVAHRFSGQGMPYEGLTRATSDGPKWTGKVALVPELLEAPLRWKKPRRVFVNSMSDLFHETVPDAFIASVWHTMASAPQHIYQILTKRPKRMADYVTEEYRRNGESEPFPQVWLGTSVEDQPTADERIPHLLATPAAVRWVSAEPLLGPIDLAQSCSCDPEGEWIHVMPFLDWVVTGGESGPGSRPALVDWYRSLRDQCQAAGVAFFFKQHGDFISTGQVTPEPIGWNAKQHRWPDNHISLRVGKKAAGRHLDGREWNEYPEAQR